MPHLVIIGGSDAGISAEQGVQVVGRVPYDTVVTEAMVQGCPVTEVADGPVREAMEEVWKRVKEWSFSI